MIRSARDWGKRPTEMLLGDYHALNRDPLNGEPLGEPEWTTWDYVLISALQLIEDFSDPNGLLVWEKESPNVKVEAVKKIDSFESAKERATSGKNYKRVPGEYFIPRVSLQYWAEEWPTLQDWIDAQSEPEAPPVDNEPSYTTG